MCYLKRLAYQLRQLGVEGFAVHLIDAREVLTALPKGARAKVLRALRGLGVQVTENVVVAEIGADHVALRDGARIASDFTICATGAHPHEWVRDAALSGEDGYFETSDTLEVTGGRNLFAVGDCARMVNHPRPRAGVFAVRQAPALLENCLLYTSDAADD